MRIVVSTLAVLAVFFFAAHAQAASCSSFAVIKSYDAASKTAEVEYQKGKTRKYFPAPEGAPANNKVPKSCRSKVTRQTSLAVKPTGGRMSITQVRSNFGGKMLNDTDDDSWVPAQLEKLVADATQVVIVVRDGVGKDAPLAITTIYLPITEEEKADIQRIEAQAKDS